MNRVYPYFLTAALLLSACGGGSGSNPAPASPPPPTGGTMPVVLTASNSKPAARAAYKSTMQSMDTAGLVDNSGVASTSPGNLQKPNVQDPMSGMLARILQKVPLGPDTFPCGISGTTTISGELASLFTLTAGDQINVEAAACDDGLGEVVSGRMEMTVAAFTGDLLSGTYLLEMHVLLIDFEVETVLDTILSNGDSIVSIDTNGNPLISMSISGNSMTTVSTVSTETISAFLTSRTVDTSVILAEPYTLSASGTIASSLLAGEITYTTPTTFQGTGTAYPFAGAMLITGANNATVRLIALDEINVRIETDTDGNGTVDATEDTTWADIAN